MNTLAEYFRLSDLAGSDKESFEKLITLFADEAVIEANDQYRYVGIKEIRRFFVNFFHSNTELKHVWEINQGGKYIEVYWGVVGKRTETNHVFALTGTDYALLNADKKIEFLKIVGTN